jgi:hypothetical protein
MATIDLNDDELRLVRSALNSFLSDFGHEEADLITAIRSLLNKLPAVDRADQRSVG